MAEQDKVEETEMAGEKSPPSRVQPRAVQSEELLQGGRELWIIHGSHVYRLIRTRNDKLILQK